MKYHEAVAYLNSFVNFERKKKFKYNRLKLSRVRRVLDILDNPHKKLKIIKVVGTKGKGSTASFINSILLAAGYKVGLFTSPHLHDFRERIKINNKLISKKELPTVVEVIKSAIEQHVESGGQNLTFFEVYTVCAFYYFHIKKVDFAVFEAGLGGRLDATNVAKGIISIITPVSYEHTDKLGKTLESITYEKASIINYDTYAVSSFQRPAALKVIEKEARKKRAKLFVLKKDFNYRFNKFSDLKQSFDYFGICYQISSLKTGLIGHHQLENASCAITVIEILTLLGYNINERDIKEGIRNSIWPGRLEIASKNPLIVLDGAQNKASMQVMFNAVNRFFKCDKLIVVLGVSADKDIRGICRVVDMNCGELILTQSMHPRAAAVDFIASHLKKAKNNSFVESCSVNEALALAFKKCQKKDMIVVCGSLFVVAEARSILACTTNHKKYEKQKIGK
jgi:dihydrofolate synthase/folylpolyglutamate synthase